jgi:outer membrane protein assembly factor BamA
VKFGFIIKHIAKLSIHSATVLKAIILLMLAQACQAESMKKLDAEPQASGNTQALPFGFFSESMETAVGMGAISSGTLQPQASLFGLGLYSTNESWLYYLAALNFQIPQLNQWLFSIDGYNSQYTEGRYYINSGLSTDGNSDSRKEIIANGRESFIRPQAKYILPWSNGTAGAANSLRGPRGISNLKNIDSWNPQLSGTSSIELITKWQRRDLSKFNIQQSSNELTVYSIDLEYDNRNSSHIPSDGGIVSVKTNHDFGDDERPSWNTLELEGAFFFDLGATSWFQQQAIGLSVWTADTPSWDDSTVINGETVMNRPPDYAGITLGGWDKLRGYNGTRFFDRSAVAYSAEYRIIPAWQPLKELPIFKTYNIPWWQWVFFIDAGNVNDRYNLAELHKEFKYSIGSSLRLSIEGIVLRMDYSVSAEDSQFRVLINQPF